MVDQVLEGWLLFPLDETAMDADGTGKTKTLAHRPDADFEAANRWTPLGRASQWSAATAVPRQCPGGPSNGRRSFIGPVAR